MAEGYGTEEIRRKYDGFAARYARVEPVQEALGVRRLRRRLLRRASGEVLEVACGTGVNFSHYPRGTRLRAVDLSPGMLAIAERRARRRNPAVTLEVMDVEALTFADASFDTVVSTLTLCTFPDPVGALREMSRVCRPDGRVLLLEHGRSDRGRLARWQDRRAERHAAQLGCYWNRDPRRLVEQAGLTTVTGRRTFLGVFQELELRPAPSGV